MSEAEYYVEKISDGFARLDVDVKRVYADFPLDSLAEIAPSRTLSYEKVIQKIYANPLIPLKFRVQFWQIAFRSNLDLAWFWSFSDYWVRVLGGRPLWNVNDFYFLKNVYRAQFQNIQVPDTDSPEVHLGAWQRPELLYQLLHLVSKETYAADAFTVKKIKKMLRGKRRTRWLEFGSGTAPITSAAIRFWKHRDNTQYYFADIETLAFHYAAYSFRHLDFVTPVALKPGDDFRLDVEGQLDVVFCIQVFEHLPNPLETTQRFWELLRPGGMLVFDFVKSEGVGLDTLQGVRERREALGFIQNQFRIVDGRDLDPEKTIRQTVAVKK